MSKNKIDSIVGELKSEEERIKNELADLKNLEQDLTKELKTVQSGMTALVGKARKKSAATKTTAEKTTAEKTTAAEAPKKPTDDTPAVQSYSPAHSGLGNGSLPSKDDSSFN